MSKLKKYQKGGKKHMARFLTSIVGIIIALGIGFMCVTGIISVIKGQNHIDYIKSWGQSAVEEVVEDVPTQDTAVILADIK